MKVPKKYIHLTLTPSAYEALIEMTTTDKLLEFTDGIEDLAIPGRLISKSDLVSIAIENIYIQQKNL